MPIIFIVPWINVAWFWYCFLSYDLTALKHFLSPNNAQITVCSDSHFFFLFPHLCAGANQERPVHRHLPEEQHVWNRRSAHRHLQNSQHHQERGNQPQNHRVQRARCCLRLGPKNQCLCLAILLSFSHTCKYLDLFIICIFFLKCCYSFTVWPNKYSLVRSFP